jgi:16S rRNA (adenine1518-N6/adenine1519-N6)-dimethyltransferase
MPGRPPLAKKRFGQNFLHDPAVIDRIVRVINPRAGEPLVEIGPGLGAITRPLLAKVGTLHVVEIDREIIPHLLEACGHDRALHVVQADALALDYAQFAPAGALLRVVGNLPYNISTPLLFHLLAQAHVIRDMHFMLQKEVVDRMCAGPGDEAYGRLSVSLAARAEVSHLFDVGPGAFKPAPKVTSAIVRIVPRPPAFEVRSWPAFDRVVTAAFGQRRKTLSNALKGVVAAEQFDQAGIDPGLRAERLGAEQFARLANLMG